MRALERGSQKNGPKRALFIIVALFTCFLLIAPLLNRALLRPIYEHVSYYLILGLFLLWGTSLLRAARAQSFSLRRFVLANKLGIICSLVVTGSVFLSVEPGYRVLSDETNLISISRSMTFERTVDNAMMGKSYFGNFQPIFSSQTKRPLLFPFFVHLLHTVRGYEASNAFLLNGITLFSLLFITFYCTQRFIGPGIAVSALLLMVSQPILTISATSAGFAVFSVLFLAIAFVALFGFLKTPNANTFLVLWVNLLALSHTRYESPAFVVVIVVLLFFFGHLKLSYFRSNRFVYALTPLLLLPILWQRLLTTDKFETDPGVSPFGFDHFLGNALVFLQHQLNFGFTLPFATAVNLLGWVAIGLITVGMLKGKLRFENRYALHCFVIVIACLLTDRIVHLSYHTNLYTHPSMVRYFLLSTVAFSLAPVLWIALRGSKPTLRLLAVGIAAVCVYHPVAMEGRLSLTQVAIQKEKTISAFLEEQRPGFLLITEDSYHYTVHRFGAVTFFHANKNAKDILLEYKKHAYSDIIVAQEISSEDQEIKNGQHLNGAYRLNPVRDVAIDPNTYLRFSRAVPAIP
jgi:hypothetical protein